MGGEDRSTRDELRKESRSSGQCATNGKLAHSGRVTSHRALQISGYEPLWKWLSRLLSAILANQAKQARAKEEKTTGRTVCFNWTARVGVRFPARSPCREMKSFKLRLLFHPLFPRNFSHRLQRTENTGGELDLASQPHRREQSICTSASSIRSCTYFESMHTNLCSIVRSRVNDIG